MKHEDRKHIIKAFVPVEIRHCANCGPLDKPQPGFDMHVRSHRDPTTLCIPCMEGLRKAIDDAATIHTLMLEPPQGLRLN